jgi:hypothetical protein
MQVVCIGLNTSEESFHLVLRCHKEGADKTKT